MKNLTQDFEHHLSDLMDAAKKEIELLDPEVSGEDDLIYIWKEISKHLKYAYNDVTYLEDQIKKQTT